MRLMNRIRVGIPVAMVILIAVALLAVNSARVDGVTTLSNPVMGEILGKCGCHHIMYGDCDGDGSSPCIECDGACSLYVKPGNQAQTCEFRPPPNNFVCKPLMDGNSPATVTCTTTYTCVPQTKLLLECKNWKCDLALVWCPKCKIEELGKNELPMFYCGAP